MAEIQTDRDANTAVKTLSIISMLSCAALYFPPLRLLALVSTFISMLKLAGIFREQGRYDRGCAQVAANFVIGCTAVAASNYMTTNPQP
jgi:hypothetical protein